MDEVSSLHTRLGLREQVAMPVRGKPEMSFSLETQAHCFMWIPPKLYLNHRMFLYRFLTYVFSESSGKKGEDKQWETLYLICVYACMYEWWVCVCVCTWFETSWSSQSPVPLPPSIKIVGVCHHSQQECHFGRLYKERMENLGKVLGVVKTVHRWILCVVRHILLICNPNIKR